MALLLLMATPGSAWAQNPFEIDGAIPDAGAEEFPDPFGSVQELGPVNGTSTKIGVVHSAAKPMLAFTNPNGQTDLRVAWLDTATADDGDIWLYFAWERDATSGSSVITYEFQKAAFPAGCVYTENTDMVEPVHPDEADLVANCNPWSARQSGDFLVVWDFKGGATDIILRTFDGMVFDVDLLDSSVSDAQLNGNTSRGEGAINLSDTVFDTTDCESIGSVITGTVTGNSDSADYKDTVFADVAGELTISNCGTVKIRKQTDPDGEAGSFGFTHNLQFLPPSVESGFSLDDDDVYTRSNVVAPGTDYYVDETAPGSAFALSAIDCSASDDTIDLSGVVLADGRVTFDLNRGETLDCTFTNTLKPRVTLTKVVAVGTADPDDFALTQDDVGVTSGETVTYDVGDTVALDETQVAGYEFVSITGDAKCPEALGGSTAALAAGDDISCTITNTLKPKVTLIKAVAEGDAEPDDFALTQNGNAVNSGQTVIYDVGATVTLDETQLPGYAFVDITGDAKCPDALGGATEALAAGDDITCTITNTLQQGAIRINKTRKYAAAADEPGFDGDASDEPHAGVGFTISGGSLDAPVDVVTDADGEACLDGLEFGDYTVAEIVPAGYVADGDATVTPGDPTAEPPTSYSRQVTVDQNGTCEGGGEEIAEFGNTPLTDVTVTAAAQDDGATRSRIRCYEATMEDEEINLGEPIDDNEGFADDTTVELDNQLPGYPDSLIVCTIEIDP